MTEEFGLRLEGKELLPYFEPGDVLLFEKTAELADGDVGVFRVGGEMLIRQYCEDNFGNIYLFSVNRALPHLDRTYPKGTEIFCYGKLRCEKIPLP